MEKDATLLLLDANVWLDYYLGDRPGSKTASQLIGFALSNPSRYRLLYSVHCICSVFYLVSNATKRAIRAEKGELSEEDALIASEFAWACSNHMGKIATAVGADQSDIWLAAKLRSIHNDIEDNLVIAAAERAGVSFLITNDNALIKHATVPALTPQDTLAVLQFS